MIGASQKRFGYSEQQMADAFEEMLLSSEGLQGVGHFDGGVYREISCRQGRPDFIALQSKNTRQAVPLMKSTGLVEPSILTLLKPTSSRTLKYLISHSEFSEISIIRSLRRLLALGYVKKTKTGSYRLGSAIIQDNTYLWAFELKLNNPKRAVFQAQQNCTFAEKAVIVVPPGQEKNYQRFSETMKRWGIGLATFDPITKEFLFICKSRKSRAFSRQHQIYTMAKIYSYTNLM